MYTLADVYKTFPSGCTEEYKILRAFEMGKQTSDKEIESLSKHILDLQKDKDNLTDRVRELEQQIEKMKCCGNCKYYKFQNDAGYYTCTRDGKRNGKNYRSCEFNLEKWKGR